jgi:hypothetical protein
MMKVAMMTKICTSFSCGQFFVEGFVCMLWFSVVVCFLRNTVLVGPAAL